MRESLLYLTYRLPFPFFFTGVAYEFPKSELKGQALFPHISSRNVRFEVNFGMALEPKPEPVKKEEPAAAKEEEAKKEGEEKEEKKEGEEEEKKEEEAKPAETAAPAVVQEEKPREIVEKENWFAAIEGGFIPAGNAVGKATRGTPRIEKREECELILLIGLPASGKTTWVNKHVEENPDKHFNVIGTAALVQRMKVRYLN